MSIKSRLYALSEFVERRWGSWGIVVFAAWALVLAFVAAARLLLLSKAVELSGDNFGSQPQIWLVFILNALFGILFAASAYGLWGRHRWGRVLFLWSIFFWSAFDLFSLFIGNDDTMPAIIVGVLRVAIGLLISLWYFNLPRIKMLFHGET